MPPPLGPLKRLISSKAFVCVLDDPTQRLHNFIYSLMFGACLRSTPIGPLQRLISPKAFVCVPDDPAPEDGCCPVEDAACPSGWRSATRSGRPVRRPSHAVPNAIGDVGHRHLEKLSIMFNAGSPALGKMRHMNVLGLVGAPRAMIYA